MNDTPVNDSALPTPALALSAEAAVHLSVTRKWTSFLSVLGFIFSGLMVIAALFFGLASIFMDSWLGPVERLPFGWFAILYIFIGALYFAGSYYLFRFSTNAGKAIATNDAERLTAALKHLRTHYTIVGVGIIAAIVLYFVVIIAVMFFAFTFSRNPFASAYDAKHELRPKFANTIVNPSDRSVVYDSTIIHPSVIQTDGTGSKVYYDAAVISKSDAKGAGAILEMVGYFNKSHRNLGAFYYKQEGRYIISFGVNAAALSDEDVAGALRKGLAELRKTYGSRAYRFRLVAVDASGVRREKLIGED